MELDGSADVGAVAQGRRRVLRWAYFGLVRRPVGQGEAGGMASASKRHLLLAMVACKVLHGVPPVQAGAWRKSSDPRREIRIVTVWADGRR